MNLGEFGMIEQTRTIEQPYIVGDKQNITKYNPHLPALWITVDLQQTTEALAGAEPGGGVPRHSWAMPAVQLVGELRNQPATKGDLPAEKG